MIRPGRCDLAQDCQLRADLTQFLRQDLWLCVDQADEPAAILGNRLQAMGCRNQA
jgi:hypothetical protein